jgi:hypothetical protein
MAPIKEMLPKKPTEGEKLRFMIGATLFLGFWGGLLCYFQWLDLDKSVPDLNPDVKPFLSLLRFGPVLLIFLGAMWVQYIFELCERLIKQLKRE